MLLCPGRYAPASQTLIVWSFEPDTILVPSWLKATEQMQCSLCFSALSSRDPVGSGRGGQSGLGYRGAIGRAGAPASQTLIVWSTPHETMVEPSGENCTALIDSPYFWACAFCFSTLSSRDPVGGKEVLSFGLGEGLGGLGYLHPRL